MFIEIELMLILLLLLIIACQNYARGGMQDYNLSTIIHMLNDSKVHLEQIRNTLNRNNDLLDSFVRDKETK